MKSVLRPWGTYTILLEEKGYKVKILELLPGKSISLQRHKHRAEHWTCVSGIAQVIRNEFTELVLRPDSSVYIGKLDKHKLINIGEDILKIIEVQTGEYLEEDDIERFD